MKKYYLLVLALFSLTGCLQDSPPPVDPNVNPEAYHQLGNPDAPVLIEEFSDLQCPACAAISPEVEDIVRKNSGIARLLYYHFPLPQHEYAFGAAEASECAADQGEFWEFVESAFANQKNLSKDTLYSIASNLNLNQEPFKTCLDTRQKKAKVNNDAKEGRRRQVRATPTLYVNGEKVDFGGYEAFLGYIKSVAESAPKQ